MKSCIQNIQHKAKHNGGLNKWLLLSLLVVVWWCYLHCSSRNISFGTNRLQPHDSFKIEMCFPLKYASPEAGECSTRSFRNPCNLKPVSLSLPRVWICFFTTKSASPSHQHASLREWHGMKYRPLHFLSVWSRNCTYNFYSDLTASSSSCTATFCSRKLGIVIYSWVLYMQPRVWGKNIWETGRS